MSLSLEQDLNRFFQNKNEGFEYDEITNIFSEKNSEDANELQNVIFTACQFPWIFKD